MLFLYAQVLDICSSIYENLSVGVCLNFFNIYTYIPFSQLFFLSILTWKRLLTYFLFSSLFSYLFLSANDSTVRHSSVWSSQRENTTTKLQRNWIISRRYYLCGREASKWRHKAWTAESARKTLLFLTSHQIECGVLVGRFEKWTQFKFRVSSTTS